MTTFDFVAWGNALVGKWVLETGESGVYRGQCTQMVTQLLKDIGYTGWLAARGNGNQVGQFMVNNGEAVFVGTNIAAIPANEIHVVCTEVGDLSTAGHVFVAAIGDLVYEQNCFQSGVVPRNYGIGNTYPVRLGRTGETWRSTRYHYKITVPTIYDNISGDGTGAIPGDTTGSYQNRFIKSKVYDIKKRKTNPINSVENHKSYIPVNKYIRGISQA